MEWQGGRKEGKKKWITVQIVRVILDLSYKVSV